MFVFKWMQKDWLKQVFAFNMSLEFKGSSFEPVTITL